MRKIFFLSFILTLSNLPQICANTMSSSSSSSSSWSQISSAENHTCATRNGELYCWGQNFLSQIVASKPDPLPYPTKVPFPGSVINFDTKYQQICAVNSSGKLYCWGSTYFTAPSFTSTPTLVNIPGVIRRVAVGKTAACAVSGTELYCWGNNSHGQIANGLTNSTYYPPTKVALNNVSDVTVGDGHVCASTYSGMYCWGKNDWGVLGMTPTAENIFTLTPTLVYEGVNVRSLVSAPSANCFLVRNLLYCAGMVANNYQQDLSLSVHASSTQFASLSSQRLCTVGFGEVLCKGTYLGDGTNLSSKTFVKAVGLNNPSAVAAGYLHTCAINSGAIYCWGSDGYTRGPIIPGNSSTFPKLILSPQLLKLAP